MIYNNKVEMFFAIFFIISILVISFTENYSHIVAIGFVSIIYYLYYINKRIGEK